MVSLASLVACDERVQKLEPPVSVITYAQCNTVNVWLACLSWIQREIKSLYHF